MAIDPEEVVARLSELRPKFHGTDTEIQDWSLDTRALAAIASLIKPGCRSIETGAGASTVLFGCACDGGHTAISPSALEHQRIRSFISSNFELEPKIRFIEARSEEAFHELPVTREFDLAMIDGMHKFPFPVVDWFELQQRLVVGGLLLLDDVQIAGVAVVHRYMRHSPAWRLKRIVAHKLAIYEKVDEMSGQDNWAAEHANLRPAPWSVGLRETVAHYARLARSRFQP